MKDRKNIAYGFLLTEQGVTPTKYGRATYTPDVVSRVSREIDYLSQSTKNLKLRDVKKLNDFMRKSRTEGFNPEEVEGLYRELRTSEGKVPTLILGDLRRKVELQLDIPLKEALEIKKHNGLTTIYLDGIDLVSYSLKAMEHIGYKITLDEPDMKGHLFINTNFFGTIDPRKTIETESNMRNIAKAFFKVNDRPHVALIQYLFEAGCSQEHYHSLDEILIQLAGESLIEFRDVQDDTKLKLIDLNPGDMITIPQNTLHQVTAYEPGSITIPIKETFPDKSDHFHKEKSDARKKQELREILNGPHTLG